MFATADDDYFVNGKNIDCLLPSSELFVHFRSNGLRSKKACFVYAEKMDYKGLVQLRLTERTDQRRLYLCTIDSSSFQQLKQDQSLHVTFPGFIENLLRLLQDCQAGKLEMHLLQMPTTTTTATNLHDVPDGINGQSATVSIDYQLQFVETRTFKNLVHLSLPCRLAQLNVVLFYMNNIVDSMQKKHVEQQHHVEQLQQSLQGYQRRIEQLDMENAKLRENLTETTRTLSQRHSEEMQQMHESLRKASEQRHNENERSRKTISGLQTQLEKINAEKVNLLSEKSQEHKRIETLLEELASAKSNCSNLKEQNDKLHAEIAAIKNAERKNEMHLNDARQHINELQDKLKKYDKTKADLVAELEAEKKITHTKRQALEIATEEISKANEIIMKQTQELLKLKKTVGWRTEVALQQEKVIKEKEKTLALRDEEIQHMRLTINSLRVEIPAQMESMRQFANGLEQKYSKEINKLREKLQANSARGKENYTTTALPIVNRFA